ncbi:hypothetical protein GCM10009584_04360 [Ornithinimicrobium humiphilum]|uniref:DUF4190 domain-containing protein n=1 Tax=Ornithinimicrobium humiphilum TaxID=125288 RepID=A0A543K7Z3_9MICO|nr:hypothetical protein [Ornithinimicrobium humiphilum]TQM91164.1 hypothetical protein FB476_2894 [Ornithinimicrobium humiphilum]
MHRFEPPPLPGQQGQAPGQGSTPGYGLGSQAPWGLPATTAHPRGTLVLILGILSVALAPILGPFAWAMSRTALKEADASALPVSNRAQLQAGLALGIIGTAFLALGILSVMVLLVFAIGVAGAASMG